MKELKIRCTNRREGCGWVGELGGLKSHLDSDKGCDFAEVACTNKGCGERVSRKDLQIHLQEKCYYRPYECEHCGRKDTFSAITGEIKYGNYGGHYSDCYEYPLDCPNRCGVTSIRRRAMPDHHSSCPLEPVDCPFKDAGCTEKIARKRMEDHMTGNQQKHMLLIFQSLKQSKQELQLLKSDLKREINSLEESIRCNTNTPESTTQSLSHLKSILQENLDKIGDTLTFRVTDFPQLIEKKKAWHSPPFSIGAKVRAHLAMYPSGVGRGQGSHVSVLLILTEVVQREENMWLRYNVSVVTRGQQKSSAPKLLEVCAIRQGDKSWCCIIRVSCSAYFHFPSPGEMLGSEELFLKIEEANTFIENESMILELKLMEHKCHRS